MGERNNIPPLCKGRLGGVGPAGSTSPTPPYKGGEKREIICTINAEQKKFYAYPMARLLDVLREHGLTGTKEGCGEGECGACSIFLDDRIVNSCLVPAAQAQGATITTIEGIASGKQLHVVQQAFLEHGGAQCGMCTPGMIMAAMALLQKNPNPMNADIREGLAGNLCRCTGYIKIFESIVKAYQTPSTKSQASSTKQIRNSNDQNLP